MALIDPYVGLTKKITTERDTAAYNQAVTQVQQLTSERQKLIQQKASIEAEYVNRAENYNRQARIYTDDKMRQLRSIPNTGISGEQRRQMIEQIEAEYTRRMADHKAPLDEIIAKRNAINQQIQQLDSGIQSNLGRVNSADLTSQVSQIKSQQESYVEQVASQQRAREDVATSQLVKKQIAEQAVTKQTITRYQLQAGTAEAGGKQIEPAIVNDTRNLQERLISQGFTKEQTQQFFKQVEGVKGSSVTPYVIKKDDSVTLVPFVRDIKQEQLETGFESLTPTQKKIVATSALFSEKGFEMIAKESIKGGEGMYDVTKRHFVDAGKSDRGAFIFKTTVGSLSGSPTGVAGVSLLGGAGFTRIGATAKGAKFFASSAGKATQVGLGSLYAGSKGYEVYKAGGNKEKLLEIGLKTGFEVGGFITGASAEKAFLLKQQPTITKAVSVEQVQSRVQSGDTEIISSKGDKVFQAEHLGQKFKGYAKYETSTKVLDKPLVDMSQRTITQDVSLSAGKMATTGSGKIRTSKFASISRATPEIEGTGVKLFESKTLITGAKKPTTTVGAIQKIAELPEGTSFSKALSVGKGHRGAEIIIVKDLPSTTTETYSIFGGGTMQRPVTKPAKIDVKVIPTTKADPLTKTFISDIKTISAGRTFAPTEMVGSLSLLQPTKTKEKTTQLSVIKEKEAFKYMQPTKQKVKPAYDQKMFYDTRSITKSASSTITTTKPVTTTQLIQITPTISQTTTGGATIPASTSIFTPFGYGGGLWSPDLGGDWDFNPVRRETPRKRKYAYTPSLTAAAFNIRFKKQVPLGLESKEFTGLEFRPVEGVARRTKKQKPFKFKKISDKKLFGF